MGSLAGERGAPHDSSTTPCARRLPSGCRPVPPPWRGFESGSVHAGRYALHAAEHLLHAALRHHFYHFLHLLELRQELIDFLRRDPGTRGDAALAGGLKCRLRQSSRHRSFSYKIPALGSPGTLSAGGDSVPTFRWSSWSDTAVGRAMIETVEMLKIFQQYRGDAIVIAPRAAQHWTQISTQPKLDLPLGDPGMGGHASFGFGLALARPEKKVVLFDSEGDVLMGLGILPTIAEHQPKNFCHFMLDNECYATTGGQPVPDAKNVSYDVIARGAGYPHAYAYDNLVAFASNIERILAEPRPVFVAMKVVPEIWNTADRQRWIPPRRREQVIKDFREQLGSRQQATWQPSRSLSNCPRQRGSRRSRAGPDAQIISARPCAL